MKPIERYGETPNDEYPQYVILNPSTDGEWIHYSDYVNALTAANEQISRLEYENDVLQTECYAWLKIYSSEENKNIKH